MCAEHVPVLLDEVIEALSPKPGQVIVDGTLGLGGHALKILEKIMPNGTLIGIDQDDDALEIAKQKLIFFKDHTIFIKGNFSNMLNELKQRNIQGVDAILLDLGVSSLQLDKEERGFSFKNKGPLDMRMDNKDLSIDAYQIVNHYKEEELADIIWQYGEERRARKIARFIVKAREQGPITDTLMLSRLIERAYGIMKKKPKTHPATRTFQALRIIVNDELASLQKFLGSVLSVLYPHGRLCVISYHSLEDRIVKQEFKKMAALSQIKILTKKPIQPLRQEILENRRSRSAKLRAFEKGGLCIV